MDPEPTVGLLFSHGVERTHEAALQCRVEECLSADHHRAAPLVMDFAIEHWACDGCENAPFILRALARSPYRNLDELMQAAAALCNECEADSACACGRRLKLARLDLHSFSSALAGDLVVRATRAPVPLWPARTELASYVRGQLSALVSLDHEAAARIGEDACGRSLEHAIGAASESEVERLLQEAVQRRIDVEFFVPQLNRAGLEAIALRALRKQRGEEPDTPR